jgi:RNA recognition motif-containing protein
MTFYVSNLSAETTSENLAEAFRPYGAVASVTLPGDRMKGGRPSGAHRGYGFVVMRNKSEGQAAIAALDGKPIRGSTVSVQIANFRRTPHYVS